MKYPSSENLSKAAAAAKLREEEDARLQAAQGQTRAAQGEERLQEVRENIAAQELDRHLSGMPFHEGLSVGGGGSGNIPPVRPIPVAADPPWWNHPAAAVAAVAVLLALIALGWLATHHDNWSGGLARAGFALETAKKADEKADKALASSEANTKAIQGHGARLDQTEATLKDVSVCDPCKKKEEAKKKAAASKCNVCEKKKHSPKATALKPLPPTDVRPPTPVAQAPKASCVPDCVPQPKATVQREEKAKVCGIAIQKAVGDRTIIGRLQLDENPEHPGSLRIASVLSFEGVATKVSRSPWRHSATKDCNEDQATVYQHWPEVVKKFQLPVDCVPTKLHG